MSKGKSHTRIGRGNILRKNRRSAAKRQAGYERRDYDGSQNDPSPQIEL